MNSEIESLSEFQISALEPTSPMVELPEKGLLSKKGYLMQNDGFLIFNFEADPGKNQYRLTLRNHLDEVVAD